MQIYKPIILHSHQHFFIIIYFWLNENKLYIEIRWLISNNRYSQNIWLWSSFLISTLESYGFGNRFVNWVKLLLKKKESCIINNSNTTKYFKLEKGTRQFDSISAYLFIIVLEIVFLSIKGNKNIKGLNIFNHTFLYTAYADDTIFSLKR